MILAIESATPCGSVALVSDLRVLGETMLPREKQVSETFLAVIDRLLADSGRGADEVSHVAVSAGPGSFTGLRVGMAAAKGFCFGWGLPIVPVPTLHALASRFPSDEAFVCPVLDAKKKEVYAGIYRWKERKCLRVGPDAAVPPDILPDWFPEGKVFFCGDGTILHGRLFRERMGARALFPPTGEGLPRASAVGLLAAQMVLTGEARKASAVVPAYVRSSEAEVRRRKGSFPSRKLTIDLPLLHSNIIPDPEVPMEGQSQEEKKAALIEKDPEFKTLVQEHRTLDEKLKEFDRKVYLSPDEEMERKRLQKLKLVKKDKIAQRLSRQ